MFTHLIATLHTLGMRTGNHVTTQQDLLARARDERGSVTIEQVLWAVAVIGIAAVVITAVTTFVRGKAAEISG